MENNYKTLKCYISAYQIPRLDPFLEDHDFCKGMVLFAVPDFGILFRCRADGKTIDMEFAALFSLFRFITADLKDEKVRDIQVFSSNPEFVFAFTGNSQHLDMNSERGKMLTEYRKQLKITIGYLEPLHNKALAPAIDYPSIPKSSRVRVKSGEKDLRKPVFKPFQKGIQL